MREKREWKNREHGIKERGTNRDINIGAKTGRKKKRRE